MSPDGPVRIQKLLSAHGVSSRRMAEKMVLAGRVTVNGVTAELGQSVYEDRDVIVVDGMPLPQRAAKVYIMLNKPRGYVTTVSDERGRKTVMSLVTDVGTGVYPVGRLDMFSEGLLLLTNDGLFANAVAHPSFNKAKTYEVVVSGKAAEAVALLRDPIEIDSCVVRAISAKLLALTPDGGVLSITISEGRNRQIRKMCDHCGLKVMALKRVSVGSLKLGSLKTGQWRHLTEAEKNSLCDLRIIKNKIFHTQFPSLEGCCEAAGWFPVR